MNLSNLYYITDGIKRDLKDDFFISSISIDSKTVKPGGLFLAINSGYKYIPDALKNGVRVIVSEIDYQDDRALFIKVDNVLNVLIKIAKYLMRTYHPLKIAITGSYGKTTTKELIKNTLDKKYHVVSNYGNDNNLIGVLKTILRINDETDYLVLEFGMNHIGEISKLSRLVCPDIGIITNIGTSHIGYLKSKRNILKAKLEILDGNRDMLLLVNNEDKYLKKIKCYQVKKRDFKIGYKYMQMNYAMAYDLLKLCGFKDNEIMDSFHKYKMYDHRMNKINMNNYIIFDDTYNSSYESLIGGLSYIKDINKEKIIVLGDILELGKYGKRIHKKINHYLRKIKNKKVLLVGELTKYIKGIHFKDNNELLGYLNSIDKENKLIYFKASHAMNLVFVVNELIKNEK